jgi:predicted metalloprotease with PDZ domain
MTEATTIKTPENISTSPTICYRVALTQPESHLFEVTLQIKNWQSPQLDLKMPVWTPGSYLIREYSRQVQDFVAFEDNKRQTLTSRKIAKNHWQIITENIRDISVIYRVFANELSVRTNHLDSTHGYFNGAALLFFVPGLEREPLQITIIPPSTWQVSTTLLPVSGSTNTFIAKDFDVLVDTPFEIGTQKIYDFTVLNKPHQLVIWGQGNGNAEKIIEDTKKIIATEAAMFQGLPYDRYLFLLHLSAGGYGGLEHKDSCSLNYPRFAFRNREKYNRFLQLVAHEFFHLWNVKRIRPQALEKFDYERENYTPSLWFSEGTTSYYDLLIPLRAGIYDRKFFLDSLSKEISKFLLTPGRKVQPLAESSFDAWIKLYRRDNNSDNNQISYYLKGELVSLLLDLLIRHRHDSQKSLDDVMGLMWERFGKLEIGFTPQQLQQVIEEVAGINLNDFFFRYLETTEELPFNEYLEPFGLELKPIFEEEKVPYLGIRVNPENGKETIKFVEYNSPAALAGIDPDDELLAIDGFKVTAEQLNERLKDYRSGDIISVAVFHQEQLKILSVQLKDSQPIRYEVALLKNRSTNQQNNFERWTQVRDKRSFL